MSSLGKRALVSYSDDEDDIKEDPVPSTNNKTSTVFHGNPIQVKTAKIDSEVIDRENQPKVTGKSDLSQPNPSNLPKKRKIAYSSLGLAENPVKFVMEKTFKSKELEEDDLKYLEPTKQQKQEINFDTVQGGKSFVLDAPREKLWRKQTQGGPAWEPFYEKKMREIYREKLQVMINQDGLNPSATTEPAVASNDAAPGSSLGGPEMKHIAQSSMTSFNEQEYLANKQRIAGGSAALLNQLATGSLSAAQEQRMARQAIELARAEAQDGKPAASWQNKKQYGF